MKLRQKAVQVAIACLTSTVIAACGGSNHDNGGGSGTAVQNFQSTILVSDGSVSAPNTDADLKNGWGLAFNPTATMWVSDNATGNASLFDGNGVVQSLVVSIPNNGVTDGGPTGIQFNSTTDFPISANGGTPAPAVFLWSTEAGTIAAWSPKVLPTTAVIAFTDTGGAVYKGLALGSNAGQNLLYATDFHNKKVDVFNTSFTKVALAGTFTDPTLPAGFSPFGIAIINGTVYVTYAVLGPDGRTQVNGAGNGVVDAFDTAGNFVKRIATGGTLNSPWGVVLAPADFGSLSNDLLVGNFGAGTIDAFNPSTGAVVGALTLSNGSTFVQPGIWGLSFGNNVDSQPLNTLFYAAGPTPTSGVYGRLDVAGAPGAASSASAAVAASPATGS